MTEQNKQLLFKDLCMRLPYGVILNVDNGKYRENKKIWPGLFNSDSLWDAKPYLRPMSSMTEEEKLHVELTYGFFYHDGVLDNVHIFETMGIYDRDGNYDPPCKYREQRHVTIEQVLDFIHWLNAHHFDYRGLIPMGLAIEATKEMYKTE